MINIYGIFDSKSNVLLYVGSTDRENVNIRWNEHKRDLKKNVHSNKTLMKYYIKNELSIEDLEFKVLYSLETENTLLKFTLEMYVISLLKPHCNHCVIKQGRTMVSFSKCTDMNICNGVINSIMGS